MKCFAFYKFVTFSASFISTTHNFIAKQHRKYKKQSIKWPKWIYKDKNSDKLTAKPLWGSMDDAFWRYNACSYLTRNDSLLLDILENSQGKSQDAINNWFEASARAEITLTFLFCKAVEIQSICLIEDDDKNSLYLCKFLDSTCTASKYLVVLN